MTNSSTKNPCNWRNGILFRIDCLQDADMTQNSIIKKNTF